MKKQTYINSADFIEQNNQLKTNLPYTEDLSVLGEKLVIKNKTFNNRLVCQAMEGCDGSADGSPDELTKRRYRRFAEGGAGLIWDKNGNLRTEIVISQPFGKFTEYTTFKTIANGKKINILERLLNVCKIAKEKNIKVILSSWFYLHTNWFCEDEDIKYLFEIKDEDKVAYFANELSKILEVLRKEDLIDNVAFAEIFNEFDGLPFVGEDYRGVDNETAKRFRVIHEKEIEKLKIKHPDVLFAFDCWTPRVNPELIPRNIDVLNFHHYYAWSLYNVFQKNVIHRSLEESVIPESTRYFLKDEIISVAEVAKEMGVVRTGKDWPSRISLYASIDENKEAELTKLLDDELKNSFEVYRKRLRDGLEDILKTHREVVPKSKLVMGEGATYCASPMLTFERDSKYFWELLKEQMALFNEKGLWGTIITTTHAPEKQHLAWDARKDLCLEANNLFLR